MKRFSVVMSNNMVVTAPNLSKIVHVARGIKFAPIPKYKLAIYITAYMSAVAFTMGMGMIWVI